MEALWLRIRRQVGVAGVLYIGVFLGLAVYLVVDQHVWGEHFLIGAGIGAGLLTAGIVSFLIFSVAGYRRSAATWSADEVFDVMATKPHPYCLILRSFGKDGWSTVPRQFGRRVGIGGLLPDVTVEQTVADAAQRSLGLPTYGIVDQSVRLAPPGPLFMRAADDEWRRVASSLIRDAATIVLILGPDQTIGDGLAWEVEQIVAAGRVGRVVIGLPPPEQDEMAHLEALHRASVLIAALAGSGRVEDVDPFIAGEQELRLHAHTLTISVTPLRGLHWWAPHSRSPRRTRILRRRVHERVTDKFCTSAFIDAFDEVRRENDLVGPPDGAARSRRRPRSVRG